ncbi:unnamed protein product, partial [marine sediment metagenome]
AEEVYEWRMQAFPERAEFYYWDPWLEDMEKMGGGRFDITLYCGGELIPSEEILQAVGVGTVDFGYGYGGYWGDVMPVGLVEGGMPRAWASLEEAQLFYEFTEFEDIVREAYAEHGVYYVNHILNDPYALITAEPVYTLDELKKMKLRAYGATAEWLASLGVSSIYLPSEEIYLALATGTIDGAIYAAADCYLSKGFDEVCGMYCTSYIFNPTCCNLIINMDVWNSLSEVDQAIIYEATSVANWYVGLQYAYMETSAIATMKERGLEIV